LLPRLLHHGAIKLVVTPAQPTSSHMISHHLPASFPTTEKRKRGREIDLENKRDLLILLGVASPSLLIHGRIGLDHVGGHARAPIKPGRSGVYDGSRACDLPHARGSQSPVQAGGYVMVWRHSLTGVWCVITPVSMLTAIVL
jgi:hypothetical protein